MSDSGAARADRDNQDVGCPQHGDVRRAQRARKQRDHAEDVCADVRVPQRASERGPQRKRLERCLVATSYSCTRRDAVRIYYAIFKCWFGLKEIPEDQS